MTASKIPVGGTGKDLQTWENDLGDGPVHTEAQTPTDTLGIPFGLTNPQDVRDASPRITRRLDAQDLLGDALFGIVGDGENAWGESAPNAAGFGVDYEPALSDSAGYAGPSFQRMQDPAFYAGRPFVRVSATGGANGGWLSVATKFGVNGNTLYDVGVAARSAVTDYMTLALFDGETGVNFLSLHNTGDSLLPQVQRYSGHYRTRPRATPKYVVTPYILLYVEPGVGSVAILDLLEFGIREVQPVVTLSQLKPSEWDYSTVVSRTADYQPISTEYYSGGSGGTLVATATCTYDEPVPGTFVLTSLEWT